MHRDTPVHTHASRQWLAPLALLSALLAPPVHAASILPFPDYPGTKPTKAADSATVLPGGTILWTITLYNDAFNEDAMVSISDDVPDPADFAPPVPVAAFDARLGGDIVSLPPGATFTYNNDVLSLDNVTVKGKAAVPPSGEVVKIVLRTRVLASAPDGTQICNIAYPRYLVETCAGSPPLCGEKTYDTTTRPPGSSTAVKTCVTVTSRPSAADVRSISLPTPLRDSCAVDARFPAPNGSLSPGEQVALKLPIQNVGGGNANGTPTITGTLAGGAGYTILGAATSPYSTTGTPNTLLANSANTGTNDNDFVIRIDPKLACPGSVTLSLTVSSITGGPYVLSYNVPVTNCQPLCLDLKVGGGNSAVQDECAIVPPGANGSIDPGDAATLKLPVTNAGPDELRGTPTLNASISIQPPVTGVSIVDGTATYADLIPAVPVTNLPDFKIQVADTVACGTAFNVRLTLTDATTGHSYDIDYPLGVQAPTSCTPCKVAAVCSASAEAIPASGTRLCRNGQVTLNAGTSTLTNCSGTRQYQWFEGANPIPAAVGATYDVLWSALTPGVHPFAVEITCSTDATCKSRSNPVDVTIDPQPLVVRLLLAVRRGVDVVMSWNNEATATGGYHGYKVRDKVEIPNARLGNANATPVFQTLPNPNVLTDNDTNAVPGMPVNPNLFHYQILAACSDQATEGPN